MVKKITIFGCGAVGATLAYNLLSRLRFDSLALVDINEGIAKGVSLDLQDTRALLGYSTVIEAGSSAELLRDSDIVIFTAGVARKDGMTRLDLLKINGKIAKDTALSIKQYAPNAIVIVVSNPLDVITYVFTRVLGFERRRVIGMGSSLDSSRMLGMISSSIAVAPSSLDGYVFGAHSEDMIVSPERIHVNGEPLDHFMAQADIEALPKRVQSRGAEIVSQLKTRSAYFAPSLAVCRLIEIIANNEHKALPVAVFLDGEYGVKDICMGVPCVIGRTGIEKIIEIELTHKERKEVEKIQQLFNGLKDVLPKAD